jgi:hypothetical protein
MHPAEESQVKPPQTEWAANGNTDSSKTTWRDIITCRVEMSRQR